MKTYQTLLLLAPLAVLSSAQSHAQGFESGSTGANGALNVASGTQSVTLPPDGILNYTTINVAAGATLLFNRNALNTPVYLLATGNVTISGTIDVSGSPGTRTPPVGGKGGPGGFDGGVPGIDAVLPGAGYGPGAGRGGLPDYGAGGAGSGSYSTVGTSGSSTNRGVTYGSPLLVPLVGGSGGGGGTGSFGTAGYGGGGGGGAILIASSTRVTVSGSIRALGGLDSSFSPWGPGSGGAIRLLAPVVSGTGNIDVRGGASGTGGNGRIRIDTLDRTTLQLTFQGPASVGSYMATFPAPLPRLDILQAADTNIPEGVQSPVQVVLPFGSTTNRTVTVQARDFSSSVPINVVITPESGLPRVYPATIFNAASNPATATVNVTLPVNTLVTINAWTR